MERLISSTCFDLVNIWRDAKTGSSIDLFVDDDGIAHGKAPHFWARGAILYGPILIVKSGGDDDPDTIDFPELELEAILAQASGDGVPWDEALFAPIPPADLPRAFELSEAHRQNALKRMHAQMDALGKNAPSFVIELPRPPSPICKCGAPDDGHWPDCQFRSKGGTVRDPIGGSNG